jgi:hypothetical protein
MIYKKASKAFFFKKNLAKFCNQNLASKQKDLATCTKDKLFGPLLLPHSEGKKHTCHI